MGCPPFSILILASVRNPADLHREQSLLITATKCLRVSISSFLALRVNEVIETRDEKESPVLFIILNLHFLDNRGLGISIQIYPEFSFDKIKVYGEYIPVHAEIVLQDSLSAHADYEEILKWLGNFTNAPKEVFITHGEPIQANSLRMKIQDKFGWKCRVPEYLESADLR